MGNILDYFKAFDLMEFGSAFIVLFAIIDPLGSIPIILNMEKRGEKLKPFTIAIVALFIMLLFLFAGDGILKLFDVSIQSFAIAGAIVLFIMALEMVCDIEIFKNNGPEGVSSIVPLAFPLFAGPGVFTAVIALRVEFTHSINIVLALILNMCFVYLVLKSTKLIKNLFKESGIYVIRKFFGIILLAISVKLFTTNLGVLMKEFLVPYFNK